MARLERSAAQAGDHADELRAEQQLRQALPQVQRMAEGIWRIEATRHELERAIEHAEAEPEIVEPQVDLEWDYHARTMDRGIDIDRGGPSLGM